MAHAEESTREHVARIYADLSRPDAYPESVDSVAIEETHISMVFLVGESVYKIKRPVDFGFLDFSTLEKRKHYCQEEVRLNQRLTNNVYRDVVPVYDTGEKLSFTGDGEVVEYAVRMRRLPDDAVLGTMLMREQVTEDVLDRVVDRLVAFYPEAATGEGVNEWGTAEAVGHNIQENVDQSEPYIGRFIAQRQLQLIDKASKDFLQQESQLFRQRVIDGKIRDAHGDLHLKHIIIEGAQPEELQIIDCVEFNPRIRCGDIAIDVAFLAMDLDYQGRSDLARYFIEQLTRKLDDPDLPRLIQFFSAYRAHVRAKVACFMSENIAPEAPDYIPVKLEIESYIDLATSYLVKPARPTVFMVGGLPGTGKSVLARRLARSLGARRFASDVVRKELVGREATSHDPAAYGEGIYREELTQNTYEELLKRAVDEVDNGHSTVIDATFLEPRWRERAAEVLGNRDAEIKVIECCCPPEVVQERMTIRSNDPDDPSEADWSIYEHQRERFGEAMTAVAELPHLVVDTNRPSSVALDEVLRDIKIVNRLT